MNESTVSLAQLRERTHGQYVTVDDGCWIWQGPVRNTGYGYLAVYTGGGRHTSVVAHRAVYTLARGPIPDGLVLDHLCRNRVCVNPAHLEPVTTRENLLRGESPMARAVRTGLCKRGHSRVEPGAVKHGGRCRKCAQEEQRLSRVAREAANPELRERRLRSMRERRQRKAA